MLALTSAESGRYRPEATASESSEIVVSGLEPVPWDNLAPTPES